MSDTLVDYNQFVRFAGTLSETGTQTFENVNATGTLQAGTTVTAGTALIGADVRVSGLTVAATPGTWVKVVAGSLAALALTNAMVSASAAIAVSKLAAGLAGQVLQGTGPTYAYPPGFEIAYDQITSGVNVASTTEGTPTAIIAGTAHTYENVPYVAEFFSPSV